MSDVVTVGWDDEARDWIATSDMVPGLATGADSFEDLGDKLKVVVPKLMEANGVLLDPTEDVAFSIRAERIEHVRAAA